ncbi:hypothetical protein HY484_03515 [Candidatus Woesearchaeota archaeon]|nr:hypothetical protein [Candidatus Woesearchaeota archaeon]
MFSEKNALGILAVVSIFAAVGMFMLQDADTSIEGQAASYYFLTSGRADTGERPNKYVDVRGEVPYQCTKPADCPEGYDCRNVKVTVQKFNSFPIGQEEYQKRCVQLTN